MDAKVTAHAALLEELGVTKSPSGPQLLRMLRQLDSEHGQSDGAAVAERAVAVLAQVWHR
eukprot:5248855-Pyramimonas_sp.AAC.2